MAKNAKTAAVKGRETKLNKKTSEELIEIILRKDKTERNLNAQVLNLKAENNSLSSRVANFDNDMQGTYQSLETYKDKCKTLQEHIDSIKIESKDNYDKYLEENKKVITLTKKVDMWRIATYVMMAVAIIAIIIVVL